PTAAAVPATLNTHNFDFVLQHTLGYLNSNYGDSSTGTAYTQATAPAPAYVGAPKIKAFPWLTWNNRPFIGPIELALVPRTRSSRLSYDYAPNLPGQPFGLIGGSIYGAPTLPAGLPATPAIPPATGHFLDIFTRSDTTRANIVQRLLDYVQ